ncbi:MAG TPA: GDP-mannose 4,6-dehydratase [Chloroflexota bacterium]|nr:GDP-mannose 4,6-dehydratase [Chloroflexota bacterium]
MRVLITGVGGFAGSHLADYCLTRPGVDVFGTVRRLERLGNAAPLQGRCTFVASDMRDMATVVAAVQSCRPDVVFHLAAQASVAASFEDPAGTLMDNAVGQLNVIRAVLEHAPAARVLVAGSAYEYGLVRPEENPIDESVPLRPMDPYAVSKVTQDLFGYQYALSHRLQAVRVRAFNHTGPRQSTEFVASRFARLIAEIEAGQREPVLTVGNLTAIRDFTDVRDVVRAYFLAATKGQPGEVYNVGSGTPRTIQEILDTLVATCRVRVTVQEDPALLRPLDVPTLICNAAKLHQHTGWTPELPLDRTLSDLLDYWRDERNRTTRIPRI